uniref:Lipoprotein n=1 Tax=Strongyloides stercoralis TaxID=6248 RepID=A0A0K0DSN9_STRER
MLRLLSCLIFFSFSFLLSCANKKKKNGGKVSIQEGKSVEGVGSRLGKVKSKNTEGYSTNTVSGFGKRSNESFTKVQPTGPLSPFKADGKLKDGNNNGDINGTLPGKGGSKMNGDIKDNQKNGFPAKSTHNNCFSAAPTQMNIFDPSDDPAADKMNLERTQNSFVEDLKDGDDTLKNVYSLPVDKDQSLKVVEEIDKGSKPSIKKVKK